MADVYVEFHPERHPSIMGRDLWWQLPRRNILPQRMFSRPARVRRDRYPSVLMRRGERRLDVHLLDDLSIFHMLLTSDRYCCYTADARYPASQPAFDDVRRSEKGRYLAGLIELFGGPDPASSVFGERYWRRMFGILSGWKPGSEAQILQRVQNKLRKRLNANPRSFYESTESLAWFASVVVQFAQSLPKSREARFDTFETEAKKEMDDFNAQQTSERQWPYSRDDLIGAVYDLTARNVLLIGVSVRCPSCGYRAWYNIDEAKRTLQCNGCGYSFAMPPEAVWHYRLNSLVQAGYGQHGLTPVVLVLGQLLMAARSSFIFAPSLDVFEKDSEEPFGDLDIAVVIDGRFVIGEVKQSNQLFEQAVFDKMGAIAKRIRPDQLIFASMEPEPNKLIQESIERLSSELKPYDIEVAWYRLHQRVFEPSPVG